MIERLLRGEVVQQARPADPHLVRDLGQAGARVPVLGEAAPRDDQDLLLGGRRGLGGQCHVAPNATSIAGRPGAGFRT